MTEKGAVLDADTVSKINELTAYTKLYYYDDIENEKLQDGLYTGLIDGLGDKYSVYYNAEDIRRFRYLRQASTMESVQG